MLDVSADNSSGTPMIRALLDPEAYPHPVGRIELLETHISWVLLAGHYGYKLKKPVDLGFVDFSTLERRRFFCEEEVRLNRRLAPSLYLGIVPITGSRERPRIGGDGAILDYAVRMRRFPQRALLTRLRPSPAIIDAIARRIAVFHQGVPPAPPDSPFGAPQNVVASMRENFAQIRTRVRDPSTIAAATRLEHWTELCFERLRDRLEQRRQQGFIRECHGDLHRGNIAVLDGQPLIFDCIEFNPGLRWIDTMSELAFLIMDLQVAGEHALACRARNRYLECTGDYPGLAVLRFYQVYRAMVRAKVLAIRMGQGPAGDDTGPALQSYLRLARATTVRRNPRLIILYGLSGSGKTRLGGALSEQLGLVHLRSDVERKRLFDLAPRARTGSAVGAGIYGVEIGQRTYARLLDLARDILAEGYGVLVDATFLRADRREWFRALAAGLGCRFSILALDAPETLLRHRITERLTAGTDASEANLAVLDQQIVERQPPCGAECASVIQVDAARPFRIDALLQALA